MQRHGIRDELHTAVVLGSGLGAPAEPALGAGGLGISYAEIPAMPLPAVPGHAGRMIICSRSCPGTAFLQGRVHYYEGHGPERISFAVRMLRELGVRRLIVTNAAGGINDRLRPGHLMLISGHWTWLRIQTAVMPADGRPGLPRRSPLQNLWAPSLRELAKSVPTSLVLDEGTYAMMSGPNYETPAEVRMLRILGADAVGMSTIPESLVAAELGMQVLGISCITNIASGLSDQTLSHADVSNVAGSIEQEFTDWLLRLLANG